MAKFERLPDLNALCVRDDDNGDWPLRDYGTSSENVRCHFRDLNGAFLDELGDADAVVGCVAWVTDGKILHALSQIQCVSLVVQKEDFLRPDRTTKAQLCASYKRLPQPFARAEMPAPISLLSTRCPAERWESVRCVGNCNSDRNPAHPRMHHKFAVFCTLADGAFTPDGCQIFRPHKVWTGSFNFTHVGGLSLENAVVITQQEIADAYFMEWAQVACLSEPLDWTSEWVAPEYRIGT